MVSVHYQLMNGRTRRMRAIDGTLSRLSCVTLPPDCHCMQLVSVLVLKRYPVLGQPRLEFSGVKAHPGGVAGEPFMSVIGGLLPIALWGRISL
jgi:hypothetical protein